MRRPLVLSVGALALLCVTACHSPVERGAEEPAKVEHPRPEAELTTVTLTPESEQRLGILTAVAERRPVRRTRLLGGEVVLPDRFMVQRWPLAPADRVRLAEALATADGELARARVEQKAAEAALTRADRLLRDKAGSVRAFEEARSRVETARAAVAAAEDRRRLLGGVFGATPEVVWIRVPIHVSDRLAIEGNGEVRVGVLARETEPTTRPGHRVTGPPSANPEAGTVDHFFVVENRDARLRLGERVAVTFELHDEELALVVPWGAVLYDVYGGEWVYERIGPHTYARRRVAVGSVAGALAALTRGPAPGATVVAEGAAELFGIEFGAGK